MYGILYFLKNNLLLKSYACFDQTLNVTQNNIIFVFSEGLKK